MSDREKRRRVLKQQHADSFEAMCQANFGKSKEQMEDEGSKFSGPAIPDFRAGWAIIFPSQKPHYWKRRDLTHEYIALCGFEMDQTRTHPGARRQFEPGNFDRCKRCKQRLGESSQRG